MDKVECVVVGAGPAGSACAIALAREGIETVLVERGREAGEKNVASFVLFTSVLQQIVPGFKEEAPLERITADTSFLCLREKDFMEFRARVNDYSEYPIAYTAYRSKFDRWFAGKAEEEGVELVRGMLVTDLLKEKGRVVGVKIGDDELLADVVVGADGVLSMVARESGLYEDDISRYKLGVKEVLDLPPGVIEERFQLGRGEGCVKDGWGYPVSDVGGVFSVYTNDDTVSIALFAPVQSIREKGVNLRERIEDFKSHPYIGSFLSDSRLREYEAHILSDGGRLKMGSLYSDGVLLCGEAGGFNSGMWVGVPPGMLSGLKAAQAVAFAKRKGRYDAETLSCYVDFLHQTGLPRMLYRARRFSDFMVNWAGNRMERFTDNLFDFTGEAILGEVEFLDPEPYRTLKKNYARMIRSFMPVFLLRPMDKLVDLLAPLLSALKRRKIRRSV